MTEIITEPSVYLVGRSSVNEESLSQFLADHNVASWSTDTEVGGEKLVEVAGRLCYMSFAKPRPGGNSAYIGHILDVGHGSVLEHSVFNLIITGVSRSFTHELVRHRAGFGYSQLSQRYVDESDCEFVVPPALTEEVDAARLMIARFQSPFPKARDVLDWGNRHLGVEGVHQLTVKEGAGLRWIALMEQSQRDYLYLSDYLMARDCPADGVPDHTARRKASRESARSVLPNATETKIFVTGNVRALRHFVDMRADPAADAEIRRVAVAVLKLLQTESPNLFGDYVIDGDTARTEYRKV